MYIKWMHSVKATCYNSILVETISVKFRTGVLTFKCETNVILVCASLILFCAGKMSEI